MVKTETKKGEGKKAFLYYFVAFVLAKLSEGCALRRTLIKILLPGALFASCSTRRTRGEPDTDHWLSGSSHMISRKH